MGKMHAGCVATWSAKGGDIHGPNVFAPNDRHFMSNTLKSEIPAVRIKNKAEAAEFFGISVPGFDGWVRRGCPCIQRGSRGISWQFDLLEIAKWRYGGHEDDADSNPEEMAPKNRLDWYRGDRERDAHAKERGMLIPFDIMEQLLRSAFAEIRSGLLGQHNIIASEYPEIPPDAIRGILSRNKDFLATLAQTRIPESITGALDALDVSADAPAGDDSK